MPTTTGLKADGDKVLSFWQAKTKCRTCRPGARCRHHEGSAEGDGAPVTLDEALKRYGEVLLRARRDGYNAHNGPAIT